MNNPFVEQLNWMKREVRALKCAANRGVGAVDWSHGSVSTTCNFNTSHFFTIAVTARLRSGTFPCFLQPAKSADAQGDSSIAAEGFEVQNAGKVLVWTFSAYVASESYPVSLDFDLVCQNPFDLTISAEES